MTIFRLLSTAALIAAAALSAVPAQAASVVLCQPIASGTASGPGRFTAAGSGTSYSLDTRGCARIIGPADAADARAQGFVAAGDDSLIAINFGVTSSSAGIGTPPASPFTLTLPAGAVIKHIILQETSGSAVTGDVAIGTTSHGTDVATGITVGASSLVFIKDVSLSKRVFSPTASQQLFFDARASTWNNAAVSVTVIYGRF